MSVVNHRCAVLGKPIAHSLSPVLHNAAYHALGLDDWAYDRHEVGQDDLDGFLHGLDPSWVGLSLTMPLKKTIQPYGIPSNIWAMQLGVANTAVFDWSDMEHGRDGLPAIRLYNTDVMGIVLAIDHALSQPSSTDVAALLDAEPSGTASRRSGSDQPAHAVILGNGNTAMSAVAACTMALDSSIGHITIAARHPDRNLDLAADLGARLGGVTVDAMPLAEAVDKACTADLVISTLPAHAADPFARAVADAPGPAPCGILLDVVYDPRPTDLMRVWSDRGALAIGGQEMLLYQAILQVVRMVGSQSTTDLGMMDIIEQPMRQALEEAL
ncbi:shikimate dehydrogenase [uncultured Bifidobacterium sp.]|uniref:shikimate dehydrogenase family protein n=1 Tax=uncultured Bifidobacterium sp. TaxID=165187 RepID=UPI002586E6A0|nr:shikimate dehydrogenase [uncultured Bifidobacterium sp.]